MIRKLVALGLAVLLAGCGAVQVQPQSQLPPPLIDRLPATVAIYYPEEFRGYSHQEERYQVKYEVLLGPAHVTKLRRLLEAMFTRVIEVDDPAHALAADPSVLMVLEPRFEDYAFLTPRDMAGDFFTVTIRYRLNVFNPQGERVDGYVFTGYGREKTGMLASTDPLVIATQKAMRDAGAKLAVEFTSQDTVRRLLAGLEVRPTLTEAEEVEQALGTFGAPAAPAAPPATPGTEEDAVAGAEPGVPAGSPAAQAPEEGTDPGDGGAGG